VLAITNIFGGRQLPFFRIMHFDEDIRIDEQ
jgi:hypothetical protein